MGKKDKNSPSSSILGNKGILAGIIVIAAIILVGILFITGIAGGTATVPPNECGAAAISYYNSNLAQANSSITLVSVNEKNGMYQIVVSSQAQNGYFYATKDCSILMTRFYTMKGNVTPTISSSITPVSSPKPATSPKPTTSPTPIPEPVKSARPSVELFVMSFCPYGVQAENAMDPVVGLLGTKSDIKVHYIATVSGTTLDSVKSLHGPTETKEDVRQLCIAKYYPQKLWAYLMDFDKNCQNSTLRKDLTALDACSANSARVADIDNQKIETCVSNGEGMALLSTDAVIAQNNKVTGSPTIFINGQKYVGQRTAEAYKQGICTRFETAPAECSVNLTDLAVAASYGSCE
jgi:glutaredoxin